MKPIFFIYLLDDDPSFETGTGFTGYGTEPVNKATSNESDRAYR